jgi:DNA invertase Pin-like site-specific DNA recombinase
MDMLVGYARVSTLDQNPQMQIDALKQAGCERLYVEKASGAHRDRPELKAALDYMRPGDTLVVWRLSRLARSPMDRPVCGDTVALVIAGG